MKKYLRYKKYYKAIKESGLFDVKYYLFTYPDVRKMGVGPIKHYLKFGADEGRNPSDEFDTNFYLNTYSDVRESGVNPLAHYILYGKDEGRNTIKKLVQEIHKNGVKKINQKIAKKVQKKIMNEELQQQEELQQLKELLKLKLVPKKIRNSLIRKTVLPEIVDIQNTVLKDGSLFSANENTNITIKLPSPSKYFKIVSSIVSDNQGATQIYYSENKNFSEERSIKFKSNEPHIGYITFESPIAYLRIDAINRDGKFDILCFDIIKVSSVRYEIAKDISILKRIKSQIDQNPYLVNKLFLSLKRYGLKRTINKVKTKIRKTKIRKTKIYSYIQPKLTGKIIKEIERFRYKPLISIIMPVYNVDPKWLDLAIKSIGNQWYDNWELCIADDKSTNKNTVNYLKNINKSKSPKIKIKFLEKNLNISGASNEALKLANGEYMALVDNDDEITPNALYGVVKAINNTGADFIYSDEDKITIDGSFCDPHFKPDFSPDWLLSFNYITHFSCFSKILIDKSGYFNSNYDGAQDYELFLRLTEQTNKIYHITKVLYHWRKIETSAASGNSEVKPESVNNGKKALESAMLRRNIKATVKNANARHFYKIEYDIVDNPLVSIIIAFKDKPELIKMCIESILNKSTYANYEILAISNDSRQKETFDEMDRLKVLDDRINIYEYNKPFNYSEINNFAVRSHAGGGHIVLLNNDVEIISSKWIEEMLMHSQRKEIGCVGGKLYYPNDTIQHAGVVIGIGGVADHSHKFYDKNDFGYINRLNTIQNVSAVTGACLMVKTSIYKELGGLNETDFKVAFNDIDFCLRVLKLGYLNIYTPYAEVYHYESTSRGYDDTPDKIARFQQEIESFQKLHKDILMNGDPYYNPNLTLDRGDFSLR